MSDKTDTKEKLGSDQQSPSGSKDTGLSVAGMNGAFQCELCRESKPVKDLWWCAAKGCHLHLCSLCRISSHPPDHSVHITSFSSLVGVDEVYSTLRCLGYKRRQLFKAFFVGLAEALWETETRYEEQLGRLFPLDTAEDREPSVSEELTTTRARKLGKQLVQMRGEEPAFHTDLLAKTERIGKDQLVALLHRCLRPSYGNEKGTSSATEQEAEQVPSPSSVTSASSTPRPLSAEGSASSPSERQECSSSSKPASVARVSPLDCPSRISTEQIVIVGGEAEPTAIQYLFPAEVDNVEMRTGVVDGSAVSVCGAMRSVTVFAGQGYQVIRFGSSRTRLFKVQVGSTLPAEPHVLGAAVLYKPSRGKSATVVCGGDGPSNFCEVYSDGGWQPLPRMTARRSSFALVHHGGFVYAIGGRGSSQSHLCSVERLDVSKPNKWSAIHEIPDLPQRLRCHAAVSFAGMIIVAGGETKSPQTATRDVVAYDPAADTWTSLPKMKLARKRHGLVVADGALYAIGGEGDGSEDAETVACSVERLVTVMQGWTLLEETTALPVVGAAFAVI